jgi:hypothetical protein
MDYSKPCALRALSLRIFVRVLLGLFDWRSVARGPVHLADRAIGFVFVTGLVFLAHAVEVIIGSNDTRRIVHA